VKLETTAPTSGPKKDKQKCDSMVIVKATGKTKAHSPIPQFHGRHEQIQRRPLGSWGPDRAMNGLSPLPSKGARVHPPQARTAPSSLTVPSPETKGTHSPAPSGVGRVQVSLSRRPSSGSSAALTKAENRHRDPPGSLSPKSSHLPSAREEIQQEKNFRARMAVNTASQEKIVPRALTYPNWRGSEHFHSTGARRIWQVNIGFNS